MASTESTYEQNYREVSDVLLEYGCMITPYMLGGEMDALISACRRVKSTPPASDEDRATVERELHDLLTNCVFHPNYRAFYVFRAMSLPHLREFSHIIERAVFHYFKQDFLSCALCLIPAVEGVLRSYAGWSFGAPTDPKLSDLKERLRRGSPESYPERHTLYAEALVRFLERWLWRPTKSADFSLSYLNRHYALHALGDRTFYRAVDCHRLLLFFDLFADLLTLEGHGEKYVFLPVHEDGMNRRRAYYQRLIMSDVGISDVRNIEEQFLREHQGFVPEVHPLRLEEILERWARIMGLPV